MRKIVRRRRGGLANEYGNQTHIAFDGIHPTFKHVPPRAPRFSIQAVWSQRPSPRSRLPRVVKTYLEAELGSFDSGDVATWSTTDNDNIVRLGLGSKSSRGENGRSEETARKGVGGRWMSKGSEKVGRLRRVSCATGLALKLYLQQEYG